MDEFEVTNNLSGERGYVRGFWYNVANQLVLNVRVAGMAASWLAVNVNIETEKAA